MTMIDQMVRSDVRGGLDGPVTARSASVRRVR